MTKLNHRAFANFLKERIKEPCPRCKESQFNIATSDDGRVETYSVATEDENYYTRMALVSCANCRNVQFYLLDDIESELGEISDDR